uniref:AMP-dependent synthetase/ligase domain-containing protein n=1 Tax=Stomoxys calcitrans TaxID=35570 RepID=A0A1I8QCK5_STOCA
MQFAMIKLTGTSYNANEKIWSGPITKNLYSGDMTVGEAIVIQLLKTPNKVIQIVDSTGETLTAQEFVEHSMTLAKSMLELGIKCKNVVGYYARHSIHLATVILASCLCGTPVSGLYAEFDKDTIINIYGKTRPSIIFCDKFNFEKAHHANAQLNLNAKLVLMTGSLEGVATINDLLTTKHQSMRLSEFPCTNLKSSDTAVILCSSGTTGSPKGSMGSHETLLHSNCYATATIDSVLLSFSTMYWASGLLNLFSSLLNSTLRIVPDKPYSPEYFLYLVKRYQVTHVFVNCTQMAELVLKFSKEELKEGFESIDTILCGGSKVPQTIQEKCLDAFSTDKLRPGFCIGYGMSEIVGILSYNGGYPHEFKPQTEGKLWTNRQVCIVDENYQRLGPNETGELMVYNSHTWLGYYNDPATTAKVMDGQWLHTGDMGYFDDSGFLHLMGRNKDMFKWKGFQICPQPIEDVLLRLTGVAEVCVFPKPDLVAGNLASCAIVRTKDNAGEALTADMVHAFLNSNLDSFFGMKGGVNFVESIPKTSTGKMQRNQVLAMICEEI